MPRLKREILARVTGGESLRVLQAVAGLPGPHCVRNWALADPEFASELATARLRSVERPLQLDDAMAAAFLARARAGETINDLLRAPGMPRRRAYRRWLSTDLAFAEAILALRQRRDQQIGERGRARYRGWDPALGDRIIVAVNKGATLEGALAADPALPSLPIVRRWRREQPQFDWVLRTMFTAPRRRGLVRGTAPRCTPRMAQAIVDRIVRGGSFASIGREPRMPSRQTLRRWVAVRPDFAAAVAQACEHREDWYYDQIQMIAEDATPGTVAEAKRRMGPLLRQLVRLRHRPGAVHRRRAGDGLARRDK